MKTFFFIFVFVLEKVAAQTERCTTSCVGPYPADYLPFCGELLGYSFCVPPEKTAIEVDNEAGNIYKEGRSILERHYGDGNDNRYTGTTCTNSYKEFLCVSKFPKCNNITMEVYKPCYSTCKQYFSNCGGLQGPTCNDFLDSKTGQCTEGIYNDSYNLSPSVLLTLAFLFVARLWIC